MSGGKSKDKTTLPYHVTLNPEYQQDNFKKDFLSAFKKNEYFKDTGGSQTILHSKPFQCCLMPNFIQDTQFLDGLREEMLDQIFYEKNNDLYKFQQTDDLKKMTTPHAKQIRQFLCEDVRSVLSDLTGITFTNRVDITCSKYEHTDVLLCHDDELDSRRVAFILYLVAPWMKEDGGTLDLFDMDEHGQPRHVVESLVPAWNSLAWFEVTEASHHQVSEVLSSDKMRLSINGWFHGETVPRPHRYIEPPPVLYPHKLIEEDSISEWINPIYLDPEVQGQIQEKFEQDSEIELQGFLREDKYLAVCEALCSDTVSWTKRGPPNKRHYEQILRDDMPSIVQECMDFLQSEEMFLTLSNISGLTLHYLAADNDSDSNSERDNNDKNSPSCAGKSGNGESSVDQHGSSEANLGESVASKSGLDECSESVVSKERTRPDSESSQPGRKKPKLDKSAFKKKKEVTPQCYGEVRRWSRGHYTLLHDTDTSQSEYALDVMLYCCCKGWAPQCGGYTSYICKGEDEELLTVSPAENSLALVYRDQETLRFVKHINSNISQLQNGSSFYDLHCVYHE